MSYSAEIGDIVVGTDETGRRRIGRVAAMSEFPAGVPAKTVLVATPEGDWSVAPSALVVVRPNFVQETWNALGHEGSAPWSGSDNN